MNIVSGIIMACEAVLLDEQQLLRLFCVIEQLIVGGHLSIELADVQEALSRRARTRTQMKKVAKRFRKFRVSLY